MNNATLIGFRKMHENMTTTEERMTAREMALTQHTLKNPDLAILPDGRKFGWSNAAEAWISYK